MTRTRSAADRVSAMTLAGIGALLALAPVAVGAGALVAGRRGALGAVLGLALPALVLAVTLAAARLTRGARPEVLAAAVLGSYLLKLVLVIAALAVLRGLDSYDRPVLGVTALVGLTLALVVEALAVTRARDPYVEPASAPARPGPGPGAPARGADGDAGHGW